MQISECEKAEKGMGNRVHLKVCSSFSPIGKSAAVSCRRPLIRLINCFVEWSSAVVSLLTSVKGRRIYLFIPFAVSSLKKVRRNERFFNSSPVISQKMKTAIKRRLKRLQKIEEGSEANTFCRYNGKENAVGKQ